MAYNRENLLKRIIKIQDRVNANKKKGISQKWTYENDISDIIADLSYSTFNTYIGMTAVRRQLKELQEKKQRQQEFDRAQLKLFEN
jgi:hypothetical protein